MTQNNMRKIIDNDSNFDRNAAESVMLSSVDNNVILEESKQEGSCK